MCAAKRPPLACMLVCRVLGAETATDRAEFVHTQALHGRRRAGTAAGDCPVLQMSWFPYRSVASGCIPGRTTPAWCSGRDGVQSGFAAVGAACSCGPEVRAPIRAPYLARRQGAPGGSCSGSMDVPADLVGTVVGVGGAGVRALEAAHGTRIVVGKPDGSGGGARRQAVRVQVFAPSADALAATRRALLAITGLDIQARPGAW